MALSIKHDPEQWQQLIDAINGLSNNLGKHQAQTREAVQQGFVDLVIFLSGGDEEEFQRRLDAFAERMNQSSDKVEDSIERQTKGDS